ncbi:imidazole glycerol phosphate synthase subunit HisH [Marinomonas sp. CT5]|uniref:imidazole glycerol phosphate synthase subunit HisH n=1 Tax=Marinomonas sp. CT5 TaxID=2066133 RepID=UPI001BAEE81C|nr:imidazole glycerol phosphate synthase subunit HisH [Marinomonas sp. CT5]QUX94512.1 imidazole glycerol phosphate synthase subunit HisH [Marinomonas sp. CT5]
MIIIIDYDLGNLLSVQRAVSHLGFTAKISQDRKEILNASHLILPGVGAFGKGMKNLHKLGLVEPIKEFAKSNRPLLGICLGMQLLLSHSEELGDNEGLDLIPGKVRYISKQPSFDKHSKVPNIGWNAISSPHLDNQFHSSILQGIEQKEHFYFVHSLIGLPDNEKHIDAVNHYAGVACPATINRDNVYGCQFHPEKSGEMGLKIISNFLNLATER